MIALTYTLSGVLFAITDYLFSRGLLSATGQTIAWSMISADPLRAGGRSTQSGPPALSESEAKAFAEGVDTAQDA